jgi:hypothetical protein
MALAADLLVRAAECRAAYIGHGGGGIRTPGTVARPAPFKGAAFNHSATPPACRHGAQHLYRALNSLTATDHGPKLRPVLLLLLEIPAGKEALEVRPHGEGSPEREVSRRIG